MAYDPSNPPGLVSRAPLYGAYQRWAYQSPDADTVVRAAGYFSNAKDLGMKVGDIVFVTDTDTQLTTSHVVLSISAAGAADLGDGTVIGSVTNT